MWPHLGQSAAAAAVGERLPLAGLPSTPAVPVTAGSGQLLRCCQKLGSDAGLAVEAPADDHECGF